MQTNTKKMTKKSSYLQGLMYRTLLPVMLCFALTGRADITFSERAANGFPIVGGNRNAVLVVDANDEEVVRTVANCVIEDIKAVTGKTLQLQNGCKSGDYPIIAGTLGQSGLIASLLDAGKVDTTGVTGQWEAYTLQLINMCRWSRIHRMKPLRTMSSALKISLTAVLPTGQRNWC